MRCPEKHCQSDNITTKPKSVTPGFYPDYQCNSCGFRWIEKKGFGLRDLHEAVKEVQNVGKSDFSRAGRREP